MTDAELWRKAAATVREIQQMRAGSFSLTGSEMDREAYARRLLELLPPADDGEAVTAEWLKAVGFVEGGPYGWESIACGDGLLMIDWSEGYHDGRPILWSHPELGVDDDADDVTREIQLPTLLTTRRHVRRLCAALGITLQEPNQ